MLDFKKKTDRLFTNINQSSVDKLQVFYKLLTKKNNLFSSTTEVEEGADTKTIYCYNFSDNVILPNKAKNAGSEYFGWIKARAFKIVTKK